MANATRTRLHAVQDHLKRGDLAAAALELRAILAREPRHAQALPLLGRILARQGRSEDAVPLLQAAAMRAPGAADVHADLAAALQNLGRNDEACAAAHAALAIDPAQLGALNALGNALRALGRHDEAVACFDRAVVRSPGMALLHLNRAGALRQAGRAVDAADACARAVALAPDHADAHVMLGVLARDAGRLEVAHASLVRAIELRPGFAAAHHASGTVLAALGEHEAAAAAYRRVLEIEPGHVESRFNLACLDQRAQRLAEARESFAAVVARAPEFVDARLHLAQVCAALGRDEEAASHFARAAALAPGRGDARNGLGNSLRALGRLDEAEAAYRDALAAAPELAEAWANLATVALDRGDPAAAIDRAQRALALDAALADAHWSLAQAHLVRGDLERGWPEYEYRRLVRGASETDPPWPRWRGGPSAGTTVFVAAEQGVGDEVMFASCVRDVLATGAGVVLECDARLVPLFARSFPSARAFARLAGPGGWPRELPAPDAWIPSGSLPGLFRAYEAAFPAHAGYLRPDPARVAFWRERYAAFGTGATIGISWRGGREALVRRARPVPLAHWAALAECDASFVNLQYGDVAREIDEARGQGFLVHHWPDSDPLRDLDDFAAQILALDLVVSVDNATVHLAGALGVPTRVLLPRTADWRWFAGRDDSPWYPSLRLLRAPAADAWDEVLACVAAELGGVPPPADGHRCRERTASPPRPARGPRRARVALVNDTTHWYHWGCTATSGALIEGLEARGAVVHRVPIRGLYRASGAPRTIDELDDPAVYERFARANPWLHEALARAEHVVVNGEGSLHGAGGYVANLLYVAYAARVHLGRTVRIVNHSCYPADAGEPDDSETWRLYRKVYAALDHVVVREPESHALLARAGMPATLGGDCLPLAAAAHACGRPASPRAGIVLAGSVALTEPALAEYAAFARAMLARGETVTVLAGANLLPAADEQEFARALVERIPEAHVFEAPSLAAWFDTIAAARLLVSGRFHHTLAAASFGTPFTLLESNTPKNQGLARITGARRVIRWDEEGLADALVAAADEALATPPAPPDALLASLCEAAGRNFDALPWAGAGRQ